jgi:hypothetical protein
MPLVIQLTVVQFLLSARLLLAWLRLQSDAVREVDAMFGTWAVRPRRPLQLDLDQVPERATRDDRASWTVTMTTRSSSSK